MNFQVATHQSGNSKGMSAPLKSNSSLIPGRAASHTISSTCSCDMTWLFDRIDASAKAGHLCRSCTRAVVTSAAQPTAIAACVGSSCCGPAKRYIHCQEYRQIYRERSSLMPGRAASPTTSYIFSCGMTWLVERSVASSKAGHLGRGCMRAAVRRAAQPSATATCTGSSCCSPANGLRSFKEIMT